MTVDVVIIISTLILSAFFSGMEIAYVSSNKIHIELEKKQGDFLGKILAKLTAKPSKYIATMLIGNNIALVIYGFKMGDVLVRWFLSMLPSDSTTLTYLFTDLQLLTQTIISTLVILFTAEFLPKVFFQIYANTLMKVLALPTYIFYIIFNVYFLKFIFFLIYGLIFLYQFCSSKNCSASFKVETVIPCAPAAIWACAIAIHLVVFTCGLNATPNLFMRCCIS